MLFFLNCAASGHVLALTCCVYTSRVLHQSCFIGSWLSLLLQIWWQFESKPWWVQTPSGPKSLYTFRDTESSLATKTIAKDQKAHPKENQQIHFLHTRSYKYVFALTNTFFELKSAEYKKHATLGFPGSNVLCSFWWVSKPDSILFQELSSPSGSPVCCRFLLIWSNLCLQECVVLCSCGLNLFNERKVSIQLWLRYIAYK